MAENIFQKGGKVIMFEKIIDSLLAIVFVGMSLFGATEMYKIVRRESLLRVSKGLNSTYFYTRKLTGESFDWER